MKSETNPAGSYVSTNNQQKTGRKLNRRAVLKNAIRASVETLEHRQLLAVNTLWVNDNWAVTNDTGAPGLSTGDTVANTGLGDDGQVTEANLGSSLTFGTNAFNSIDSAVDEANSGDTIRVLSGIYTASSTINVDNVQVLGGTPTTLGDNSGVDKSTIDGRDSSRDPATSVREALIINGGSITVTASGVTVAGFTFRDDSFGAPLSIAASGSVVENNVFTGNVYGLNISGNNANVRTNYFVQNNAAGTNRSQGINVNGGATGVNIHDNSLLTHNNAGATRPAGIVVQGTNTSATINNNFIAKSTVGVRIGSGASAIVTNNNFEGGANPDNSTDILFESGAGSPGSITGNTLAAPEFIRNLSSQAVSAHSDVNVYQQPSPSVLPETDNYAIEDRIFHKIDSASSGLVTWVADTIFVTDTTSPAATNNDYTRIANALDGASDGNTINLKGSFDWTETNAAASWVKGNDGVSGNGDDYQARVPAGLDNVTLTAPGALGDTTILGPGDLVGSAGGFLTFRGGPNVGWNISNLTIQNFEIGIGMFYGSPGVNTFDGTQITGNHIVVATDLNPAVAGLDDIYPDNDVNVGIHYSFGDNQSISNNTIDMAGTGVSDYGNGDYAASIGVLSNTSGSAYSNLNITGNTINVTGAQSIGSAEVIRGIWENGHAHGKTINVSNNQFLNLSGGNNPASNLQRAFTVTSHSTGSGTVTYSGNTVSGANLGWQWLAEEDFSGKLPVEIIGNTLTNVATGLLIQSSGSAHLVNNTLTNPTPVASSMGVRVASGSSVTLDDGPGVVPADSNEISGFDIGVKVLGTATVADNVGSIYGNNVGIDVDGISATATISGNHIYDNNIGIRIKSGASAAITGNDFEGGADDNLTDLQLLNATSSVTGGTLTGNKFAGSTFFIDNQSNSDITAIATTAVPPGTNTYTETNNYRIEDKIYHAVDTDLAVTNGLVTWNANDVYVTTPILGSTDSSIQRGIDVATVGDTVNVEAGTYQLATSVNVNKQLTLLGAQGGVDARTRAGAESIVDASAVAGYPQAAITVASGVNGAIIDGFTVQGATGLTGVYLAAGSNSTHVVNNIIRNNTTGLYLSNTNAGNALLVEHNLFIDNTAPGAASGHGIYVDGYTAGGSLTNVDINENKFTNTSPVLNS